MAVPTAALRTPLSACAVDAVAPPTWLEANCLHSISSARNWSKLLPVPGNTITLGPSGIVVQPAISPRPATITAADVLADFILMMFSRWVLLWRSMRFDLLPASGALLDVGVVAFRFAAVIPVAGRRLNRRGSGLRRR